MTLSATRSFGRSSWCHGCSPNGPDGYRSRHLDTRASGQMQEDPSRKSPTELPFSLGECKSGEGRRMYGLLEADAFPLFLS